MRKYTDRYAQGPTYQKLTGNRLHAELEEVCNAMRDHVLDCLDGAVNKAQSDRLTGLEDQVTQLYVHAVDQALQPPLPYTLKGLEQRLSESETFVANSVDGSPALDDAQRQDIKDIYGAVAQILQHEILQRCAYEPGVHVSRTH